MFTENNSLEIKIIERLKKRHHDKKSELHIIETRLNNVLNCFNPDDYCFDYEQQYCALIKDDFDPIGIKSYKRLTDEIIDNITVKYDSNDDIHLIDVNIHLLCMKKNKGLQYSNGIQSKKYCNGGVGLIDKGFSEQHYLCLTLKLKASHLWIRPYNEYQQFLYEQCVRLLNQGETYNSIADYLNKNEYKTVRNKIFKSGHVFSIVKKKRQRDVRLSRVFEPIIDNVYIKKMS